MKSHGELDVSDLVGRPWSGSDQVGRAVDGGKSYRCYGLAREVLRRFGVYAPEDQGELLMLREDLCERLEKGAAVRSADVLVLLGQEGQHMGVCLSATRFIHATRASGVCIQEVARFSAAGQVLWIARPRGAVRGPIPTPAFLSEGMSMIRASAAQSVRDAEWWNKNRPDAAPMDCEAERVIVATADEALAAAAAGDHAQYSYLSGKLAAYAMRAARE